MFDESWKNWLAGIVTTVLVTGFIGFIIYVAIQEEKAWQEYKVIHNCKVIHRVAGYNQLEYVDKNGAHYRWIPERVTYKCDNDEIIER